MFLSLLHFIRYVKNHSFLFTRNITKVNALKGINVDLYRGDKVALIGHNGSGKSTFIRLASKIYHPSRGKIVSKVEVFPMLSKSFIVCVGENRASSSEFIGFAKNPKVSLPLPPQIIDSR